MTHASVYLAVGLLDRLEPWNQYELSDAQIVLMSCACLFIAGKYHMSEIRSSQEFIQCIKPS